MKRIFLTLFLPISAMIYGNEITLKTSIDCYLSESSFNSSGTQLLFRRNSCTNIYDFETHTSKMIPGKKEKQVTNCCWVKDDIAVCNVDDDNLIYIIDSKTHALKKTIKPNVCDANNIEKEVSFISCDPTGHYLLYSTFVGNDSQISECGLIDLQDDTHKVRWMQRKPIIACFFYEKKSLCWSESQIAVIDQISRVSLSNEFNNRARDAYACILRNDTYYIETNSSDYINDVTYGRSDRCILLKQATAEEKDRVGMSNDKLPFSEKKLLKTQKHSLVLSGTKENCLYIETLDQKSREYFKFSNPSKYWTFSVHEAAGLIAFSTTHEGIDIFSAPLLKKYATSAKPEFQLST